MANMERMLEGMEQQVLGYKKQLEEAEEIAALNLAKYRKAQQQLEEVQERERMALNSARNIS